MGGRLPEQGQVHALQARGRGLQETEQQAGQERRPGTPLAEDHGRQGHVALAGAHLPYEACSVGGGEVGAGDPAQEAGQGHCPVAQPRDRDAGAVHRLRRLSHRTQAQAEAGPGEQQRGQRRRQEGQIDDELVAAQQLAVGDPEQGHVLQRLGQGEPDRLEALGCAQGRGLAAALEERDAEGDGQARGQDVQGQPADDLVAPLGDAGEAVHQGHAHRDAHRGQQSQVNRSADARHRGRGKGAAQQLALQRDVDDPGPLREEARQGAQDERSRQPQGGVEGQQDLERELAHAGAPRGRRRDRPAIRRARGGSSM